jgi:hypothetical protein
MLKKCLLLVTVLLMAATIVFAQGTFKPRDADEEHAWRLYNQYIASKKQEAGLKAGITQKSGDIKTTTVGVIPLYVGPQDVSELAGLRRQLQAEQEKQKNLETAWDKKFWGRYGDLSDSSGKIYDPKTKKTMDKIQFRLIYFPFHVEAGATTAAKPIKKQPAIVPTKKPDKETSSAKADVVKPGIEGLWWIRVDGSGFQFDWQLVIAGNGGRIKPHGYQAKWYDLAEYAFDGKTIRFQQPGKGDSLDPIFDFEGQMINGHLEGTYGCTCWRPGEKVKWSAIKQKEGQQIY